MATSISVCWVRWRRRDHGPALHPVKSTVAKAEPHPQTTTITALDQLDDYGAIMEQRKITRSDLVSMFLAPTCNRHPLTLNVFTGWVFARHDPRHQTTLPIKRGSGCGVRRHLVFFNTTPAVCGPVIGSLLPWKRRGPTARKLMTVPLRHQSRSDGTIGRSWRSTGLGTLRPITAALGASLALSGNISAPCCSSLFSTRCVWR